MRWKIVPIGLLVAWACAAEPRSPEIVLETGRNAPSEGVEILYRETFASGETALDWRIFPGFSPDPPRSVPWEGTPTGDGWAGLVTNESFGGFASLSYAGAPDLADYSLAAWVYVVITDRQDGPLQGLAFRVDPERERFYRLAARFGADPELTFAYVGRDVDHFPVELATWGPDEIPGGMPETDGWHRLEILGTGNRFTVRWNEVELPGGPIVDDRIRRGYFGIYANFVGGQEIASTAVDELMVTSLEPGR